jgi:hypothetical protein
MPCHAHPEAAGGDPAGVSGLAFRDTLVELRGNRGRIASPLGKLAKRHRALQQPHAADDP